MLFNNILTKSIEIYSRYFCTETPLLESFISTTSSINTIEMQNEQKALILYQDLNNVLQEKKLSSLKKQLALEEYWNFSFQKFLFSKISEYKINTVINLLMTEFLLFKQQFMEFIFEKKLYKKYSPLNILMELQTVLNIKSNPEAINVVLKLLQINVKKIFSLFVLAILDNTIINKDNHQNLESFSFTVKKNVVLISLLSVWREEILKLWQLSIKELTKEQLKVVNQAFVSMLNSFFSILEKAKLFKSEVIYEGKKQITYITLTKKATPLVLLTQHLPMIYPPKDFDLNSKRGGLLLNREGTSILCRTLQRGESQLLLSNKIITQCNVLQKKKYRINKVILNLLKDIFNDKYKFIRESIGLLTKFEYVSLKRELVDYHLLHKEEILEFVNVSKEWSKLKKQNKGKPALLKSLYQEKYKDFFERLGSIYNGYIKRLKKIKVASGNYEVWLRNVRVAEMFQDYDLYFVNFFDFRSRFYPLSWLFSRTSGIYQYLLQDAVEYKIQPSHLEILEILFWSLLGSEKISKNLSWFLSLTEDDFLLEVNKKNYKIKNPIYLILVYKELKNINQNGLTNFYLELDQKSSGIFLLGFLCGSKKLLKILLNEDIYVYFCEKYRLFFNNIERPNISEFLWLKIIEVFTQRNIMKYFVMCYSYNQTSFGRYTEIIEPNLFTEEVLDYIIRNETMSLIEIKKLIFKYVQFFNTIFTKEFPELIKFTKNLTDLIVEIIKKRNKISWYTLDGSYISYTYYNKTDEESPRLRSWNFEENRSIQSRLPVNEKIDYRKHKMSFIPNFIHSLDSFFIREIALKIYTQIGYCPETLHDQLKIRVKDLTQVQDIISNVYFENQLTKELIYTTFLKANLVDMDVDSAKDIEAKFELLDFEPLKYTKKEFIELTRNMFTYK